MAFCPNCGSALTDGAKFCSGCGASTASSAPQYQPKQYHTEPPVGGADPRDVADNKSMAILAYILFFIPMLVGAHKISPYVRFHTNQGILMFLAWIAYSVVVPILSAILLIIPILGGIAAALLGLLWIPLLVFNILGIVNASQGLLKPLPFAGEITIIR
ncbi:MAG: zinc-ribbon domain-containing protein [Clostridiales bacterium]|jgi:uncharacterized membrane protein|nr:zinc-ribbon domain-containing protein [Clostridiales bacterium]